MGFVASNWLSGSSKSSRSALGLIGTLFDLELFAMLWALIFFILPACFILLLFFFFFLFSVSECPFAQMSLVVGRLKARMTQRLGSEREQIVRISGQRATVRMRRSRALSRTAHQCLAAIAGNCCASKQTN